MKINIYDPRIKKNVSIEYDSPEAKGIYRYYIATKGAVPLAVLPRGITYDTKKKKFFTNSQKPEKRFQRITYQQVKGDWQSSLYHIFKGYQGKTITYSLEYNGGNITETEVIPDNFHSWWETTYYKFMIDSDTPVFGAWNEPLDLGSQAQLIIQSGKKVKPLPQQQSFLDGTSHCVFTPMREWINKNYESETGGRKTHWRAKKYLIEGKQLKNRFKEGFIHKYKDGVPDNNEDFQFIADKLNINIKIQVPSTDIINGKRGRIIDVKTNSTQSGTKDFNFLNVRLNHIELNEITNRHDFHKVSKETIKQIQKEKEDKGEFYLYKTARYDETCYLQTLQGIYTIEDKYHQAIQKFNDKYNVNIFKINHLRDPMLSQYVRDNININSSIILSDDFSQENFPNHIDMEKAYSRSTSCPEYEGYLGKITDYRYTDKIEGIGIYEIENINFKNCKYPIIELMKAYHERQSYPSPELKFLKKIGVEFDIRGGCWGTSFNMEMEELQEKNDEGLSHYKRFFGMTMVCKENEIIKFKCNKLEDARLMASHYDCEEQEQITYIKSRGEAVISLPNKSVYHQTHITCFINSYARLNLYHQLFKFKPEQIGMVNCDGIFFKGEVELTSLFKFKDGCYDSKETVNEYILNQCMYWEAFGPAKEFNQLEVCIGPGGGGKTHHQLTDKGLVGVGYFAPTWKLLRNKCNNDDYNCIGEIHNGLISPNNQRWNKIAKYYNTLVIDEISMLDDRYKERIIKRFPNHKIIFCGDLGYQLGAIDYRDEEGINHAPIEFKINEGMKVIEYNTLYRCKCMKLEKILKGLRKIIKEINEEKREPIFGFTNWSHLLGITLVGSEWVKQNYNYKKDLLICSTHLGSNYYNKIFSDKPKYKIIKKYKTDTQYLCTGDIVFDVEGLPKDIYELRQCFTIHSIQGETAKGNLYIELTGIHDLRMIYTALSRAEYFKKIFLIQTHKDIFNRELGLKTQFNAPTFNP